MKIQIEKYMKFKNSKLNTYKVSGAGEKPSRSVRDQELMVTRVIWGRFTQIPLG